MKGQVRTPRRREGSEVTRARLIQSAEKIFARDGFEAAKLEEIAAEAGYTRGAFYANFESKEDLFFSLLEREVSLRIENASEQLAKFQSPDARLQTMRTYFMRKGIDRRWSLLSLEFKLFAIRHPEVRNRLATINRRFISSWVANLEEIARGVGHELTASSLAVGTSLSAVLNSMTVEHMLDRALLPDVEVEKILGSFFDCLTGGHIPARKSKKPAKVEH